MYIEAILRDIDADEARLLGSVFHDPSLQMRARLAAQATVRVPDGTAGWGAWLWNGLVHPRQTRAPIQRQPPSQLTRRQRQDTRQSRWSGCGVKPRRPVSPGILRAAHRPARFLIGPHLRPSRRSGGGG